MNPNQTLGGNPTRDLVPHPGQVLLAVHLDDAGQCQGVYVYKTSRRAMICLEPTIHEDGAAIGWNGWEIWHTAGGRYAVTLEEVR